MSDRIWSRLRRRLSFALSMVSRPLRSVRMVRDESLVVAFPPYHRRALRVLVEVGLVVGLLCAAVLAGIATATIWLTLVAVAALAAIAMAALWERWRAGPASLRVRNLPPGELTKLACPLLDFDHMSDAVAEHGPVFTTNHLYTPTVAVYGLERGQAVLRDSGADLCPMPRPDNHLVEGGFVRVLEGDGHRQMRGALAPLFGAGALRRLQLTFEREIGAAVSRWPEEFADQPVNPRPLVDDLVLDVWITLFFGPSTEFELDRLVRLRGLYRQIDHLYPTPQMRKVQDQIVAEVQALGRLPDLPDSFLADVMTRSPGVLDDLHFIENLVHLVTSTHADMTGLFVWIVKFMADSPEWLARLREADADERPLLADAFVSETLRLAQSEVVLRYTKNPIEIGGFEIPEQWMVRVLVRESHRDPGVFDDPLAFRPDRFMSGNHSRLEYSPFGLDQRSCIGETLTRTAAGVFVESLAHIADIETCTDGPPQLSIHRHAAPSHHWTVRFRPRSSVTGGR